MSIISLLHREENAPPPPPSPRPNTLYASLKNSRQTSQKLARLQSQPVNYFATRSNSHNSRVPSRLHLRPARSGDNNSGPERLSHSSGSTGSSGISRSSPRWPNHFPRTRPISRVPHLGLEASFSQCEVLRSSVRVLCDADMFTLWDYYYEDRESGRLDG